MPEFLDDLRGQLKRSLQRYRNRALLEGAMAGSALVAVADGSVSFGQRVRVDQILGTLEALQVFDPHEGVNLFNEYTKGILKSPKAGRAKSLKAVQAVAKDPATVALIFRICVAITSMGRGMQLVVKVEIMSLCSLLGVEPGAVESIRTIHPLSEGTATPESVGRRARLFEGFPWWDAR